ncbi:Diacylglycerol kinase theta [Nymphon striatum]|nr:Diacylglycerol kinase theta [Nymphon striatum]
MYDKKEGHSSQVQQGSVIDVSPIYFICSPLVVNTKDNDDNQVTTSSKDKERDEEVIKVYDGNSSMRRRMFRTITVPKTSSRDHILAAALRSFYIADNPNNYYVTDAYSPDEVGLPANNPVPALIHVDNRRPAIFLRFRNGECGNGRIRVYPGRLRVVDASRVVNVESDSTVDDVIQSALDRFGLNTNESKLYKLTQVTLDKGNLLERSMEPDELPWEILKNIGKESIKQMEITRFYLQQQEDPHGSSVALFVGNLPTKLSQLQYEKILVDIVGKENKFDSIGPIYYEYGSLIITFANSEKAVKVFYMLRESSFEDKSILVLLLPNVMQDMIPEGVRPLLIFVNVKSGGCQGQELISSFRKLLNPYQVFDLENGGPLPGLYVFRFIKDYKILACGGDGTVGWVLQCLDNVGQDSVCQSPPCAIVPLGTGNDLARVLRWGSGFTGCEDPLNVLKDIIDAEEITLDRWTVVFHFEEKPEDRPSFAQTAEDNSAIFVMNNYFGIGIDADLCLDFHNAREENPNKFNSRLRNKGVYVKMGLRKMVSRKSWKDLHREVRLEVDGKVVDLPPVEGIIILNILSWGSGANPWGPEREDQFAKPTHYDGMLEVVGVTGVVHMGQILSGLRSAIRIAQGANIRIKLNTYMPVQVDGEPWVQSPGEVNIIRSALKATMLKKIKGKIKRRNTEPSMLVAGMESSSANAQGNSAENSNGATGGPF